MANRSNCRSQRGGDPNRARAEAQARAIIAQKRASAQSEPEEPMNRYIYPIPQPASSCPPLSCSAQVCLERILEAQERQTGLLSELLTAVQTLTAAALVPPTGSNS